MAPRLLLKQNSKHLILLFSLLFQGYFSKGQVPVPTAASPQILCEGATISNLQATSSAGNSLNLTWYPTSTSDTPLAGNTLLLYGHRYYVAEHQSFYMNHVSSLAGGLGNNRSDVVADGANNLYITDGNVIKKYDAASGTMSIYAGSGANGNQDGKPDEASFSLPGGLAIDNEGNLYVADTGNGLIRKVDKDGSVTTIAGAGGTGNVDGPAATALFNWPMGIAWDPDGTLYVADFYNHQIRIIKGGSVGTLAGNGTQGLTDGTGTTARFYFPTDITRDSNGDLYIADNMNARIRRIGSGGNVVTVFSTSSMGFNPIGIAARAGSVYITGDNHRIIKISYNAGTNAYEGEIEAGTFEGDTDGIYSVARIRNPQGVTVGADGSIYFAELNNKLKKVYNQLGVEYSQRREVEVIISILSVNVGLSGQTATANVVGLNDPYTFSWSPSGATTRVVPGLEPGQHTVTVTDTRGCTATSSVTITAPPPLEVNITDITDISCFGETDGRATVIASGGTGPYTYEWSNGDSTPEITGLGAGPYTITVTDANGATATAGVTITEPEELQVNVISITGVSCFEGHDGRVDYQISGGTPPYDPLLLTLAVPSGSTQTGDDTFYAYGLYSRDASVRVYDARNCRMDQTSFVPQPAALTADISSITPVTCETCSDGSATAFATGGTAPYTFEWSEGSQGPTAGGLGTGQYTVIVTDDNGCTFTTEAAITVQDSPLIVTISDSTHLDCFGYTNGAATALASGGTAPYSYEWSNGDRSAGTTTGLSAGTYTVTVTDADNTTAQTSVIIREPEVLTLTLLSQENVSCNGGSDGSALFEITGGVGPYAYNFVYNIFSGDILPENDNRVRTINLSAQALVLRAADANGCSVQTNYLISAPPVLSAEISDYTHISIPGASDGRAVAEANGGASPYAFEWSTGAVTPEISGLDPGHYTVTVTDDNGCTSTAEVTLSGGTETLTASITDSKNVTCFGLSDGGASVTATGGTAPYSYEWSNRDATATASGLPAGTHTVTVTDADGATATAEVTIQEPLALYLNISDYTDITCRGQSDATLQFQVIGGTAPYSYSWDAGSGTLESSAGSSPTVSGLGPGLYIVRVTDANGCSNYTGSVIVDPDTLTVVITSQTNASAPGATDGSATIAADGGNWPYNYEWSNGNNTATASGLAAGNYTVTVTDISGCVVSTPVSITAPGGPALEVSITNSTNVSCYGLANGSATALANGGTAPYSYEWSNGGTAATATGLSAGNYTVTATDGNGASVQISVTISQPEELRISNTLATKPTCYGGSDGILEYRIWGGVAPYSFHFDQSAVNFAPTGDSTLQATGLAAGMYTAWVTDTNGCQAGRFAGISQPDELTSNLITQINASAPGAADGTATVEADGGTAPYSYLWSNGATTATVSGLSAGNYTVTVTDDKGCETTSVVSISAPGGPPLSVTITYSTNVSCFGAFNGSATALATGGTAPYNYTWETIASGPTVSGLSAGTYTVTVTDADGSTASTNVTITTPDNLIVSIASQTNTTAPAATDGSATATANGGTAPYSYLWSNGTATAAVSGLSEGSYTVTVTDDKGCTAIATVGISGPDNPPLGITVTHSTDVSCNGLANGSATAAASGGAAPYRYEWSNGATTALVTGLSPGTYTVTVTDGRDDTATTQVTILEASSADFKYVSHSDPQSCGSGDGSITFGIKGLAGNSYTLIYEHDGDEKQVDVTVISGIFSAGNLLPGIYSSFRITDQNCTYTLAATPITLTNPAAASATVTPDGPTELCEDDLVSLTASEGASYLWSSGQTSRTITVSAAGTYSVSVTSAQGCRSEADITVTEKVCNLPPVAVCKPLVVLVAGADCYAVLTAKDLDAGSYDPNGDWTRHTLLNSDGIFRPGEYTVTYEVMDPKGAFSTCESQVRVLDHTPPVARARDLVLELNASGQATISIADVDAGSSDNCGPVTMSLNRTTFDCSDLGNLQVRLTVTDASGNVSEALSDIRIVDNTPPVISATNLTLALDENGLATISNDNLITTISDNCGIWNVSVSQNEFTCEHIGENEVVITIEDVQGNRTTATVTVTVKDTTSPVVSAKDLTLYLDKDGKAALSPAMANNGSIDNCGITGLSIDREEFGCQDLGEQTLTLTAVDGAGNTSETTFTVTVLDTLAPIVLAKDITLYLDAAGEASLTPDDIDEGSSDNCGIADRSLQYTAFDCPNVGTQPVEYTVTDLSGNRTTVIIRVTVRDTIAPEVFTQNVVLELDGDGKATLAPEDVDGQSSDNCGIARMTLSQTDFSCNDLGRRLVALTVTDVNGNQSTARAVAEVKDPNGVCPCSYGVLAFNGITLTNNHVSAGGVGVINSGKKAKLRNTVIDQEGTFVKAPQSRFDTRSEASTYIRGAAPTPGAFRNNPNKDKNKEKAGKDESRTLAAGRYGKVKAAKGATLTFSGGEVYIRSLKTKKNTTLTFTAPTTLLVRKGVKAGRNTALNTGGEQVHIYAGSGISVGNASEVRGILHTQGRLKTRRGSEITSLEGLFVADKIRGAANTHWAGGGVLCTGNNEPEPTLARNKDRKAAKDFDKLSLKDSTHSGIRVSLWPNPVVTNLVKISVESDTPDGELMLVDLLGNILFRKTYTGHSNTHEINMKAALPGTYVLRVNSGEQVKTLRVIKEGK